MKLWAWPLVAAPLVPSLHFRRTLDLPPGNLGRLGLAAAIRRELSVSERAALRLVDDIRRHMLAAVLSGEKVKIRGFGTLLVKRRKGHLGRNPLTKKPVAVPPYRAVIFNPSDYLVRRLNGNIAPGHRK